MKLKFLAFFLLFLFSLVIAFPGYSANRTARVKQGYISNSNGTSRLVKAFLKCLSTGINVSEEEKSTEEGEEDTSCEDVSYIIAEHRHTHSINAHSYIAHGNFDPDELHSRSVPCPPPDCGS